MKKHLLIWVLSFTVTLRATAGWYSVNYDKETVAAMVAAFGTETATEMYYTEQVKEILDRYSAAEVATAGIFMSKWLDRRALTELGIWSSPTENFYYRRIYHMVSAKIMPKIWTVAQMMLHSPQTALYWGSYLYKVCTEVESLCMQFESVVTNGSLNFRDVVFLKIAPQFLPLFRLAQNGDIDWQAFFDDLSRITGSFTKENLQADIDNLYNMGVGIATSGMENMAGELLGGNSFNEIVHGKLPTLIHTAKSGYRFYRQLDKDMEGTLLSMLGGAENVSRLFDISGYDIAAWMTDYAQETMGRYYVQRWYIYRQGSNRNQAEEVYEAVFDSYSMDLATFQGQLNARLSEYNDNENGYVYQIGSDGKNYYNATNAGKLKGTESVIISVTCHDGYTLMEGNTQYKCGSCGSSVNAHTKECAMKTTLSDNSTDNDPVDVSGLDEYEAQYNAQMAELQGEIDQLTVENDELIKEISEASIEDAAILRQQYNANKREIERLTEELEGVKEQLAELNAAREESAAGEAEETDDYYRIPAIMQECKTAFDLTWDGEGHWEGNSYVRTAHAPGLNTVVTFRATVSIVRKPKYFLGIKIHRAIVGIGWELTAEYSDTQVVDVLDLDPGKTDRENAQTVNDRLSKIAREYPSCSIGTEYIRQETPEQDDTSDVKHLLWSSDRLEIAREVDARLTQIYADLVSLEKMMHYKLSILDVLMAVAPEIDEEQGRRRTLVDECHQRWMENANRRGNN